MKILVLLLLSASAWSQISLPVPLVSFDQNPSQISWRKIDSPHFEIIFPEEVESKAQIVSNILESAYPVVTKSLDISPRKISIILQSKTLNSNGFVTLAPRRSEFFLTPSTDPVMTNTEWLTTLGIHEFRHVVQFEKTRQGFTRYLYILLGEVGDALGLAFSTPPWFLEGDAVGIETAVTQGGRGRLPLFERDLKALALSKDYKMDQLLFGSYNFYTPNHYVFGYFFTSFLREKLGHEYAHLVEESARSSYNPLSFYFRADEFLERPFDDFIKEKMKEMIDFWNSRPKSTIVSRKLSPQIVEGMTSYLYPQMLGENKFFALKQGLGDINQFVIIDGRKERTIYFPAPLVTLHPIKVRGDKFAVIEQQYHPRWGLEDFGTLKVLDLEGKVKYQRRNLKWRTAILNQTGSQVAGLVWNEKQEQFLSVIDLARDVEGQFRLPQGFVVTSFDWIDAGQLVFVAKNQENSLKGIFLYDLQTLEIKELHPLTEENFGFVASVNQRIFIESPRSGVDNIYELIEGNLYQLTSSEFGSYAPTIFNEKLVYNDYSFRGMNIKEQDVQILEATEGSGPDLFKRFFEQETIYEKKEFTNYPSEKYSHIKNSLNFHSWNLLSNILSPSVAVEAFSRDLLNENSLSVGALYNYNEGTSQVYVTGAHMRQYPVFSYRAGFGSRMARRKIGNGQETRDRWEEGAIEGGVTIPWKQVSGRFLQTFNFYGFNKLIHANGRKPLDKGELNKGTLYSLGANVYMSAMSRMSARDLQSPWGASLFAHYESAQDISGREMSGKIFTIDSRFYLPGLMKHHSFFHQVAYERQWAASFEFQSFILTPRGLNSYFLDDYLKYSANYMAPLFYPDLSVGRYLYLKRVSTNLFYDQIHGHLGGYHYEGKTTGLELMFETYLLRLTTPIILGIRYAHVIDGFENDNVGFFINTSLSEF